MGKNKNKTLALLAVGGIVCLYLVFKPSRSVESLGNGFEEVTYTHSHLSEPEAHQISLQYRDAFGKQIMIWPSLDGVNSVVKGDVALFVGNKAGERLDSDRRQRTMARLFAVKASGPSLDITDEVLLRWAKQSEGDFAKSAKTAFICFLEETNNVVGFHFGLAVPPDWPNLTVYFDWTQIEDIMREVREKGVQRKDSESGVTYFEKEFKPESQK